MKLSNKILLGFFGLILIYLLAAFAEIRLKGDLNVLDRESATSEIVEIGDVKHLIVPDIDRRVTVKSADENKIEILSYTGNLLENLHYEVSGDTLKLLEFESDDKQSVYVIVYTKPNSLERISVDRGSVLIKELNESSLSIDQRAGWVRIEDCRRLANINVVAREEAEFNINNLSLDTLSVQSDDSRIVVWADVLRLEGSVFNDSFIQVRSPGDIDFKRDDSSVLLLN